MSRNRTRQPRSNTLLIFLAFFVFYLLYFASKHS